MAAILTESKSASPAAQILDLPGYDLYENPGLPASHVVGKWGIMVTLWKGLQLRHQLEVPASLHAWAIALDVVITSPYPHVLCLLRIYTPSDVAEPLCLVLRYD